MLFPIVADPRYFNPVETSRGFPMQIEAPLYGPRKYSLFQSRTGAADWVPYALSGPNGRLAVDGRGRVILAHRVVLPILSAMRQIGAAFGGTGAKYTYYSQWEILTRGFTFLSEGCVYMPVITITQAYSSGEIQYDIDMTPLYKSYFFLNDNPAPGERRRVWHSESAQQTFSGGGGGPMPSRGISAVAQYLYRYAAEKTYDLPKPVELVPISAIPGAMDSAAERLYFPFADEPPFFAVDRDNYPAHTSSLLRTGAVYFDKRTGTATLNQELGPKGTYFWTIDTDLTSAHDERAIFSHFGINGTPGSSYHYRFKGHMTLTGANGEPLRAAAGKLMLKIYRVKESAHTAEYITDDPTNTAAAAKWPPLELLQTLELITIASPVDSAEPVPYPLNPGLTFELEACRLYCFELCFDGVSPLELVEETVKPLDGTSAPALCSITKSAVASLSYGASDDILEFFNP